MNDNTVLRPKVSARQTSIGVIENFPLQMDRGAGYKQFAVKNRERQLLSGREGTIVALVGSGRSNKEIARELGIAPETIKSHLKRIFQKLSASTRAQAVIRAQNFGLIDLAHSDIAFGSYRRK